MFSFKKKTHILTVFAEKLYYKMCIYRMTATEVEEKLNISNSCKYKYLSADTHKQTYQCTTITRFLDNMWVLNMQDFIMYVG